MVPVPVVAAFVSADSDMWKGRRGKARQAGRQAICGSGREGRVRGRSRDLEKNRVVEEREAERI